MRNKNIVLAGVGVILVVLLSIQIVDPSLATDEQTEVAFTAPPKEVIRTSIQHTSEQSFTYEMLLSETQNPSPNEMEFFMQVEVEESAKEYSSVGSLGKGYTYGNDAITWRKYGRNQSWSAHPFGHSTIKPILTEPFRNLELQNGG